MRFAWLRRLLGIPSIHQVYLLRSVIEDICAMARDAHPKEVLVYLSSTKGVQKNVLVIDELQLQTYQANENSAYPYLMQLPTVTNIMGTAHSHPGGSPRPSEADLGFFARYGIVHAIVPEPYTPEFVRFYDVQGKRINVQIR